MFKLITVAATALMAAMPVAAHAAADLSGLPADILSEEWAEGLEAKGNLFGPISFDADPNGPTFAVGESHLADVVAAFGGTVATTELFEGSPLHWLCYDSAGVRTWFVSYLDDTEAQPLLNFVAQQALPLDGPACPVNPATALVTASGSDIPGIGASVDDLKHRFGDLQLDDAGHAAYYVTLTLGDADSWTQAKTVYYLVKDKTVTAVVFDSFTSADAAR